jgi:hypothetical protein
MSVKTTNKGFRTRVDVTVKKGAEELFPKSFIKNFPHRPMDKERKIFQLSDVIPKTPTPS